MDVVADGEVTSVKDVHTEHCCIRHGCKYGNADCTVTAGGKPQSYPCEWCEDDPAPTAEEREMTASLLRAIQRDPNPNGRWKGAIPSEDGTQLLIDTADGRTFILTVREV